MPLLRSKRFYKNQLESIEEYQDDLDSIDVQFRELKAMKASLRKKIKGLRTLLIDEGGEDLLREWEEKRAVANAPTSHDAEQDAGSEDAGPDGATGGPPKQ